MRQRAADRSRFLFGITGPPGSGKSTIAVQLARELDAPVVPMDGFHLSNRTLDERGLRDVKGAPETFAAAEFVLTVERLHVGSSDVLAPDFDRIDDEPRPDRIEVKANDPIVIVEGNYLLLDRSPWSRLLDFFDSVGYIDVAPNCRIQRLIERHVAFGRSVQAATTFVRRSDERNTEIIEASRSRADVRITEDPLDPTVLLGPLGT